MQSNFAGMQEDALRRAREMYSRGRPSGGVQGIKQEVKKENTQKTGDYEKPLKRRDAFEFLLKDPDKTIILALIIILSSEKAESSLIFALMFLLM